MIDASLNDLPYRVEAWSRDGNALEEILAACGNQLVAKAAFEEACRQRPRGHLMLRCGARVIDRRVAG